MPAGSATCRSTAGWTSTSSSGQSCAPPASPTSAWAEPSSPTPSRSRSTGRRSTRRAPCSTSWTRTWPAADDRLETEAERERRPGLSVARQAGGEDRAPPGAEARLQGKSDRLVAHRQIDPAAQCPELGAEKQSGVRVQADSDIAAQPRGAARCGGRLVESWHRCPGATPPGPSAAQGQILQKVESWAQAERGASDTVELVAQRPVRGPGDDPGRRGAPSRFDGRVERAEGVVLEPAPGLRDVPLAIA